ncbi:MAG: yiaD 2, partial [Gammaproteobacteria bacterium]|nr:yiaD 2 [Gammaproteobacteria bacterium]
MKHKSTNGHQSAICRKKIPQNATHILPSMTALDLFKQVTSYYLPFLFLFVFIAGCASSDFSRGSASEVDKAYLSADYAWNHSDGSLTDSYQNSSQTAKSAVIGAVAGLGASSLSSGINIVPGIAVGAIVGSA